jgi:hypothetical protein
MRKQARRTKARKVESRLSCRTVNLRNPLSAIRRTAPRGFEPSDRPSDAGTPAFPLGFPSPAADSSECPPESPAAATPPESPSHHTPHPHTPPSAASAPAPSRSSSPAGPPAPPPTDDDRAHSQAPPPHSREAHLHSPKRALSSLFASYAHRFLHLPPFFRLHQRGIDRHRLHLHLPQRIPPVQKGLQDLVPDPLLLKFPKPPPGRRIGAIWARPIAPPAAGNPHIQDPVKVLNRICKMPALRSLHSICRITSGIVTPGQNRASFSIR